MILQPMTDLEFNNYIVQCAKIEPNDWYMFFSHSDESMQQAKKRNIICLGILCNFHLLKFTFLQVSRLLLQ